MRQRKQKAGHQLKGLPSTSRDLRVQDLRWGQRHEGPLWNTIPPPAPSPELKHPEVRIHQGEERGGGEVREREGWSIPWRVTCYLNGEIITQVFPNSEVLQPLITPSTLGREIRGEESL